MSPNLVVRGGTPQQQKLVKLAAVWYLKQLIPDESIRERLYVVIRLRKDLFKRENVKGDCAWEDNDEDSSRVKPTDYEITIDASMSMHAVLRTLAHELTHVKQFATGEMVDQANWNLTKWKGKIYDQLKINYFDTPWEIEAYGRETGLYENFVRSKGLIKEKWYIDTDYTKPA